MVIGPQRHMEIYNNKKFISKIKQSEIHFQKVYSLRFIFMITCMFKDDQDKEWYKVKN